LIDCRITNAVRCVPPENKPTPQEITTCRDFLKATIAEMNKLRVAVALGRIAHESFVLANDVRRSQFPFAHGQAHALPALTLFDSYHCSRYNTNTGVLTPQMFRDVIGQARKLIDADSQGVIAATP
jgi:uracil-DNA glycosylase family 4